MINESDEPGISVGPGEKPSLGDPRSMSKDLPVLNTAQNDGGAVLGGPGTRKRLFKELGGRENIEKVVDRFYDLIDEDPELRPIFPESMEQGRARQKLFLEEWLGGEPRYTTEIGPWQLRRRHAPFRVTETGATRWVGHMELALFDCGASKELAAEIASFLRPVAFRMVNSIDSSPSDTQD